MKTKAICAKNPPGDQERSVQQDAQDCCRSKGDEKKTGRAPSCVDITKLLFEVSVSLKKDEQSAPELVKDEKG